ncbi:MAG: glycosyltransferase [Candidatus Diapherotrites archaeon]
MNIKPRTVLIFPVMLVLVYFIVKIITFNWIIIFFNILLIFINSVFLFAYLEIKDKKKIAIKKWPSVTIVIPNYNGEACLAKCIEHVKNLSYPSKKEIIVVDDGSNDNSQKIMQKIKGIKIILKKNNEGKAAALNDGIAAAKGEYVVTIDSDTYPEPDCLEKMVSHMEEGVSAVTGFVRAHNTKGIVEKIQEVEYLIAFGFFQKVLSDINAILVTPGPMSLYRKSILKEIGGFDEKNITEDMEIAFRIRKYGGRIVTCIEAHIYTEVPTTLKQLFRQRVRWYRGKFFNTVKYSEMLFNPKFGEFGMFTFPFSVILEWVIVLFVFIFIAGNLENIGMYFGFIYSFLSVSTDVVALVPRLFALNSSFFFYLIGAAFYSFFLYYSHKLAGAKLSITKVPEITLFILIYSFFILVVFFVGFFKEINSSDYVW